MTRSLLVVAFAVAFGAACGGSGPDAQSPYPACAMPDDGSFTGRWTTNLGDAEFTQDGATVVGTWKNPPDHKTGRIEGTARGCLLFFSWTQTDELIPNMPRVTSGHGVFRYVIDPAVGTGLPVHRFEGTWGYGEAVQGGGSWTGRKRHERE